MDLMHWAPLDEHFGDVPVALRKFCANPSVDLYEEDDALVARISVPGLALEDMDITVTDDVLTISGERREEKDSETKDYYTKEILRGLFSRSIRLPKAVRVEAAKARYADGVLVITLPTRAEAKTPGIRVPITYAHNTA